MALGRPCSRKPRRNWVCVPPNGARNGTRWVEHLRQRLHAVAAPLNAAPTGGVSDQFGLHHIRYKAQSEAALRFSALDDPVTGRVPAIRFATGFCARHANSTTRARWLRHFDRTTPVEAYTMQLDADATLADEVARQRAQDLRRGTPQPRERLSQGLLEERCADFDAIEGEAPSDPVLGGARSTRRESTKIAAAIQEQILKLTNDPTRNAAQIALSAADYARDAMDRQLAVIEERRNQVSKRLDEMRVETESLMQPPDMATKEIIPEARTALRNMDEKTRDNLIETLRQTPEYLPLVYAIASAPAFVSGVHIGQRQQMRTFLLALRRPVLITLPGEFERELQLLDRCAEGFSRSVGDIADFQTADALRQLSVT